MHGVITAASLLKTTGILTASPDNSLGSVLPKLSRSHDAIFVFDRGERNEQKLLGVVNPYYVLFKKNLPPETKVKHCLYYAPKLSPDTPFWDIARNMISSKLYFLPVFNNEQFLGVVSVNRLFAAVAKEQSIVKDMLLPTKRAVITIDTTASVEQAFSLLRKKGVSRVVVIDSMGRLSGMVTRYMLHTALSMPRTGQQKFSRKGDKRKRLDQKLSRYYKNQVVTVPSSVSGKELFRKMLAAGTSSITIISSKRVPVGIVSTHDVLSVLARCAPQKPPSVQITCPKDLTAVDEIRVIVERAIVTLHGKKPVLRAECVVKMSRNPKEVPVEFRAHTNVFFANGKKITAHDTNRDWREAIHTMLDRLQVQCEDM